MPIITATELRNVLGVSVTMYSNEYLEQIIASSEQVILPLLVSYSSAIEEYQVTDDVITFTTVRPNYFVEGQSVVVTGCAGLDDTYTVDARASNVYQFTASVDAADSLSAIPVIPAGVAVLDGSSAADLYANTAAIKNALLVVSTEIFQSVVAPGGQIEGVDFAPTPYRMGRSLTSRVMALLLPYVETETIAQ
jgi:hypothetical protein